MMSVSKPKAITANTHIRTVWETPRLLEAGCEELALGNRTPVIDIVLGDVVAVVVCVVDVDSSLLPKARSKTVSGRWLSGTASPVGVTASAPERWGKTPRILSIFL